MPWRSAGSRSGHQEESRLVSTGHPDIADSGREGLSPGTGQGRCEPCAVREPYSRVLRKTPFPVDPTTDRRSAGSGTRGATTPPTSAGRYPFSKGPTYPGLDAAREAPVLPLPGQFRQGIPGEAKGIGVGADHRGPQNERETSPGEEERDLKDGAVHEAYAGQMDKLSEELSDALEDGVQKGTSTWMPWRRSCDL